MTIKEQALQAARNYVSAVTLKEFENFGKCRWHTSATYYQSNYESSNN